MKYCKACGDNIPDSVRFCPSCGSAVEEQPLVNIQKEEVAREHHEWKFLTERLAYGIFQVRVHTNVTVEEAGSRLIHIDKPCFSSGGGSAIRLM